MDCKKQAISLPKASLTGKKRKKKKKELTKDTTTDVSKKQSTIGKESKQLECGLTVRKIETQCSSSSSIESQKPIMKLARMERTSSTGTRKQVTVSFTNEAMESRSRSNDSTSTVSETTMVGSSSQSKSLSSATIPVVGKVRQDSQLSSLSLSSKASLRWFDKLSDEEEEKERIEEYKKNRRDRYRQELISRNEQRKPTQHYYRSVIVK